MALGIVIIATVAAYLSGFIAWIMGAGVLMSISVFAATGGGVTLALGVVMVLRIARERRDPRQRSIVARPQAQPDAAF